MVHYSLSLIISILLLSTPLSICQASSFIHEDYLAYPRYKLELTEKGIPESSVFGGQHLKDKQLGRWDTHDYQHDVERNQVIMMTDKSQPFLCTIPDVTAQERQRTSADNKPFSSRQEIQRTIERGLDLLKPMGKECLRFYTHGYWTYEYCHMQYVRQFHIDPSKTEGDNYMFNEKSSYILGVYPQQNENNNRHTKDSQDLLSKGSQQQDELKQSSSLDMTTLRGVGDKRLLVQHWGQGTPCDITNQPRSIEIQFQCALGTKDEIEFFEEVSTCHYLMIISTPRLCDDVMLGAKKETKAHAIQCNPIVPEHLLDEMEAQVTKEATQEEVPKEYQQEEQGEEEEQGEQEILDQMAKTELVDMISDLARQVEQLQRSMDIDHRFQHSQIYFMDQHGHLVLGSANNDRRGQQHSATDAAQAIFQQLLLDTASTNKDIINKNRMDESETQHQNKKAYEKNYYTLV
ncbi:uncharacterized protein BX664DRAFT_357650 [Halteromyces radiatus]|uniref:uncharacterized protein n=1 Tax=Halteromyces radiatus TaxID=101107 RepID=UPI00221F0987|nr:uncharacterized protein BX664DRAFT_357650 [Halteromyces radiatus]KAI8093180.1 hypothetical protein BX664DRAFT_357650 [Halteromyces radiatus]